VEAELVEGAIGQAGVAGVVAGDLGDDGSVDDAVLAEGEGHGEAGVDGIAEGGPFGVMSGDGEVVEIGLLGFGAAEEPEGVEEVGDEFDFDAVDGLVGEEEIPFELPEAGFGFGAGEDGLFGAEAVGDGVTGRAALAFGGGGAIGLCAVAARGFGAGELGANGLGWHTMTPDGKVRVVVAEPDETAGPPNSIGASEGGDGAAAWRVVVATAGVIVMRDRKWATVGS